MNQTLNENERLLEQVINKDIVNIIMNSFVDNAYGNVNECEKYLKLETELLNKNDFIEKEIYDKLFKRHTTLEKHCIPLEVDTQLNQEIFQRDNSMKSQSQIQSSAAVNLGEEAAVLRDLVDHVKANYPLDHSLEYACSGYEPKEQRQKRVKPSTSASGSQPSGNTKKDKIQQTPSSTQKNKVEAHPRKVKSSLKNK
ncbi:hypothetical protein Tco_0689116, partial [Tanacetum coccineum]